MSNEQLLTIIISILTATIAIVGIILAQSRARIERRGGMKRIASLVILLSVIGAYGQIYRDVRPDGVMHSGTHVIRPWNAGEIVCVNCLLVTREEVSRSYTLTKYLNNSRTAFNFDRRPVEKNYTIPFRFSLYNDTDRPKAIQLIVAGKDTTPEQNEEDHAEDHSLMRIDTCIKADPFSYSEKRETVFMDEVTAEGIDEFEVFALPDCTRSEWD